VLARSKAPEGRDREDDEQDLQQYYDCDLQIEDFPDHCNWSVLKDFIFFIIGFEAFSDDEHNNLHDECEQVEQCVDVQSAFLLQSHIFFLQVLLMRHSGNSSLNVGP
jgi:hypothetical protein